MFADVKWRGAIAVPTANALAVDVVSATVLVGAD